MQGIFEHAPTFFQVFAFGHDLRPFYDLSPIASLNSGVGGGVSVRHIASWVHSCHQLLPGWVTAPSEAELTWAAYLANTPAV